MIVSYNRSFVFIKTRKTASTSVEVALSGLCGDGDILAPISPIDELFRLRAGRGCQNFSGSPELEEQYRKRLLAGERPRSIPEEVIAAQRFWNHMPVSEICARINLKRDMFMKFTIERHPYDKVVSYANFYMARYDHAAGGAMRVDVERIGPMVDKLIEGEKLRKGVRNYDLYTIDGQVAVDRIMRYERLHEEFEELLRDLAVHEAVVLPKRKVGGRDKTISASEILSSRQKAWVREVCAEEFELLGYEP